MTEYKQIFLEITAEETITEEETDELIDFIRKEWESHGEFRIDRADEELDVGLKDLFGEV